MRYSIKNKIFISILIVNLITIISAILINFIITDNLIALTFYLLIFFIDIVIALFVSKQITTPIEQLAKQSAEIADGNISKSIKINSRDEAEKLSIIINKMDEKNKSQIQIIKKDRDELRDNFEQRKVFFDNVTHELKTPITTILGYSQIIKDNGFNEKDFFDRGIEHIISESKRLDRMVGELLDYSKSISKDASYKFKNIDISPIIKNTSKDMNIKGKKYNILIECNADDELSINGDKDKIKEVLINLIDNSLKYGKVNSIIRVDAYLYLDNVILKVRDEGEGINEKDLENIFQPFYRVSKKKSREKGSNGLGLSITKAIVENHGGTIKVESKIKKGTTVTINLPAISKHNRIYLED
ncbi:MAG: sensor histidine kinase [Clostridiaceae bacterium]